MAKELDKLKRKAKRRKRKAIILTSFFLILFVGICVTLVVVFFVANNIIITDNSSYNSLEMLDRAGFKKGMSLFKINDEKLTESLKVEYPYVKKINAKITFPDTVTVEIERTIAEMSLLTTDGKYLYLDEDMKVLEQGSEEKSNILFVKGIDVSEYTLGKKINAENVVDVSLIDTIITEMKNNSIYGMVKTIDMTKKYNITLNVNDTITIELGLGDDIDKKLAKAKKIMDVNGMENKALINVKDYTEGRYRPLS